MKKITLKRILISNWRGQCKDITFSQKTYIKGKNGCGKTTIMKSFYWLLTGYTDADKPKNYNIFDNRVELNERTPKSSVKAWIDIDGVEYKLEREAQAKFIRKRGSNIYEKAASDTYIVKIDDIECSSTTFNQWIDSNIADMNMLVYILDGSFFSSLSIEDKKEARKVLEALVGDILIDDMSGDYSLIMSDIKKYGVDVLMERTKEQLKPLKKNIDSLLSLMERNNKEISLYRNKNYNDIKNEIDEKEKQLNVLVDKLVNIYSDDEKEKRSSILSKIQQLAVYLGNCRIKYEEDYRRELSNIKIEIEQIELHNKAIEKYNLEAESEYENKKSRLNELTTILNSYISRREDLIKSRDLVKSRVFSLHNCAYCGQPLPLDKIEEFHNEFNREKQQQLDCIVDEGKTVKAKIDEYKDKIEKLQAEIDNGIVYKLYKSKDEAMSKMKELDNAFIPYEETEEYNTISNEIDTLKASMPTFSFVDKEVISNTKNAIVEELKELNIQYSDKYKMDALIEENKKYEEEHFSIGCSIAKLESIIDKINEYLNEKASIVASRINNMLEGCFIEMFRIQKDGSRVEDCVIKSNDGVNFATLNNSSRILVNIQLQKLFMNFFNVEFPTFIDECAIFNSKNIPNLSNQSILLFASDDDELVIS